MSDEKMKILQVYRSEPTSDIETLVGILNRDRDADEFKLYFEKIAEEIEFLDLIEDCSNACFSFTGIILDNTHNEKIREFEKGFEFYQNNELENAISHFKNVLDGNITIQSQIYGLSYYYLIVIYLKQGYNEKAQDLYNKFIESDIEDKSTFIKELENKISVE